MGIVAIIIYACITLSALYLLYLADKQNQLHMWRYRCLILSFLYALGFTYLEVDWVAAGGALNASTVMMWNFVDVLGGVTILFFHYLVYLYLTNRLK